MSGSTAVLMIGIDGLSLDTLTRYKRYVKTLNKLMKQGFYSVVKSPKPLLTSTINATILTGLKPERHCIFDFVNITKNYEFKLISSIDVPYYFWDLLPSEYKVLLINVPLTYPAPVVRGYVISDFMAPSIYSRGAYYPMNLLQRLEPLISKYKVDLDITDLSSPLKAINEALTSINVRTEIAKYLIEILDVNFVYVYFQELDRILHYYPQSSVLIRVLKALDNAVCSLIKTFERIFNNLSSLTLKNTRYFLRSDRMVG